MIKRIKCLLGGNKETSVKQRLRRIENYLIQQCRVEKCKQFAPNYLSFVLNNPDISENDFLNLIEGKEAYECNKIAERRVSIKLANKEKINFIFLVHSCGQIMTFLPLLQKVRKNKIFEVSIGVYPFFAPFQSLEEGRKKVYTEYEKIKQNYPEILIYSALDENGKYVDFTCFADIAYFSLPYDHTTFEYYTQKYFVQKKVLTVYSNYSFFVTNCLAEILPLPFFSRLWINFVDDENNAKAVKEAVLYQRDNVFEAGYLRMDQLCDSAEKRNSQKPLTILLAPHYMVNRFANFYKYAKFYQKLPSLYPDIKFIWRPHPLLYVHLQKKWGKRKTEKYYQKLVENKNVEWDKSVDYFKTFQEADALIHECGSFLAEYLFTEKPACYVSKQEKIMESVLTATGFECWKRHYKAYSESDIIAFIDNLIAGIDDMKNDREIFVKNVLKKHYHSAAERALACIIKKLEDVKI